MLSVEASPTCCAVSQPWVNQARDVLVNERPSEDDYQWHGRFMTAVGRRWKKRQALGAGLAAARSDGADERSDRTVEVEMQT